jgi:transforming growth factor-beta-induced protein
MRKVLLAVASAAVVAMSVVGISSTASAQDEPGTIVEIAQGNEDLSTLVAAVTAAELVETLSGDGPFTVFAPTNDAFDALPAGTLDSLLADPKGALADILKLHVMSGAVDSKAAIAAAGGTVDTLGGPISVELDGDKLIVGGATVVTADVKASNGIVHIIDAVITKPASAAPTEVATGDGGLAASSSTNLFLLGLGGLAIAGVASSSVAVARQRRRN